MGLPRRRKTRLKLLAMAALSAVMVTSLATATMAWYSVTVNISVTSSTVTIRTPFQYYFYAYEGNGFTITESPEGAAKDSFTSGSGYKTPLELKPLNDIRSYTEVDALRYLGVNQQKENDFITALTTVTGLWPGYKMSFAIKATGLQSDDAPQLKSTAITLGSAEGAHGRYHNDGSGTKPIYMANAITIYAKSAATLAAACTSPADVTPSDWRWSDSTKELPETEDIDFGNAATPGGGSGTDGSVAGEWWYFYTIEFDDTFACHYTFVGSGDGHNNSTEASSNAESTTEKNYYKLDTSAGNSNCFQGLTFSITTMTLQND